MTNATDTNKTLGESMFAQCGYAQDAIDKRVSQVWYEIFEGPNKFYWENDEGLAYVMDTGNNDVRTEALSAFPAVQRLILRQKMRRCGQTRRVRQNLYMEAAANAANVGDGVCSLRKIRQTRKNRLHANLVPQRKPRKRPTFNQR